MCGIHIGSRQQRLVDILSVACIVHLVGQHVDLRLSRLASDAKTQSQQRDHSGAAQLSKTVRTHGCPLHELLRNYAIHSVIHSAKKDRTAWSRFVAATFSDHDRGRKRFYTKLE